MDKIEVVCINHKGVSRSFSTIAIGKSPNSDRFKKLFLFNRIYPEATATFLEICNIDITDIDYGFEAICLCHSGHNVTLTIKDYDKDTGNCVDCIVILPLDVAFFLGLDSGLDTIGVVTLFKQEDE